METEMGKWDMSEAENNGIGAPAVSIIRIAKSVPKVLSVFGISVECCSQFSPTLTCSLIARLIARLTILTSLLVCKLGMSEIARA